MMSNQVYENYFYNEDIKRKFINDSNTKKTLERMFKISRKSEVDLGKDLYNFNREQIRRMLFIYSPNTIRSSRLNLRLLSGYIDWAIVNGYLKGVSPLIGVDMQKWPTQFVTKILKKYWTEDEINLICSKLVNYQDSVVVKLLFEGVRGKGNSELVNLSIDDIDNATSKLRLYDDLKDKKRNIIVSQDLISLCKKANEQPEYIKSNGKPSHKLKAKATTDLIINDKIIRSSTNRSKFEDKAKKDIIHRKIDKIKILINEPKLTPKNIVYSGMIWKMKEYYNLSGSIGDEEYELLFEHFGEDSEQVKYGLKSDFLNLETIKGIYQLY